MDMDNKKLSISLVFTLTSFEDVKRLYLAYFPDSDLENFNQYLMEFQKNNVKVCIRYTSTEELKGVTYNRFYTNKAKTKIGDVTQCQD